MNSRREKLSPFLQDLDMFAKAVSIRLSGAYKPFYDPMTDCGDYVIVKNCRTVRRRCSM